jgi:predicted nucleotidyltransferase
MNKAGIQGISDRISGLCSEEPAIDAAYIFGSRARGSTGPERDLDVALLLNEGRESDFFLLSFMSSLERACECRADVVILNHAGEILKHEVRRTGRLIFERDLEKRKQFEVSGRKRYEDFLYLHRKYSGTVLYGEEHG